MTTKRIWLGISMAVLVILITVAGCDDSPTSSNSRASLNGTWQRGSSALYYQIKIEGNNWIYSEGPAGNINEYSKGTWSSDSSVSFPSTGSLTFTITHINIGGWQDVPTELNNIKTNSASYEVNSSGTLLTVRDAALTTAGVWATLEGSYQKN